MTTKQLAQSSFSKEVSKGLKGILALIIVGSHLHYVTNFYLFDLLNKVATTSVALFLFISGYGLSVSYLRSPNLFLDTFFVKRFWKVLKPMLIATLFYLLLFYLDYGVWKQNIIKNLVFKGYTPLPNSWFIFALLYYYTCFYVALRMAGKRPIVLVLTIFALAIPYLVYTIGFSFGREWWVTILSFPTGVLYAFYRDQLFPIIRRPIVMVLFTLIVGVIVYSKVELLLLLTYVFIPLVVVALLSYIRLPFGNYVLQFFGMISYEIYLLHGIFINLFHGNHIDIILFNNYLYAIMVFVATILFAYLFHHTLYFNERRVEKA